MLATHAHRTLPESQLDCCSLSLSQVHPQARCRQEAPSLGLCEVFFSLGCRWPNEQLARMHDLSVFAVKTLCFFNTCHRGPPHCRLGCLRKQATHMWFGLTHALLPHMTQTTLEAATLSLFYSKGSCQVPGGHLNHHCLRVQAPPHTNTTLLSHPTYVQPFCKGGVIEQWVIQQSVSLSGAGPSRIVVVGETVQLKNCMLEVLHSTSQTCSAYCMPSGQPSTHGRRAGSLQVSGAGAPASAVSLSPPHVCPLPGLLAALTGPQNKQSFEQLVSILSIHFQTPIPTTATPARFARSHPGLGCQGCTPEA